MAMGFVPGGGAFQWFGDKVKAAINRHLDDKMHQTGAAVVARAQAMAPVRTGALRASISYLVQYNEAGGRSTLHIQVGMPYGIYQEFGTRNIPPHPFIRPALNEIGRIWGFDVNMQFAAVPGHAGLLAGTGHGRSQAGFAASASPRFRPLTPKQIGHVEKSLIPSIKRHHRGNVKRARFSVG